MKCRLWNKLITALQCPLVTDALPSRAKSSLCRGWLLSVLVLLVFSLSASAQQVPSIDPQKVAGFEKGYNELRCGRSNWSFLQRSYPNEKIPRDNRFAAFSSLEYMRGAEKTAGPAWSSIGPSNIGGRVNSLAIDPSDENTIYTGAADGGVWKSADAGGTWTPLTDNLPSLSMGAIGIDPVNPKTIYAGTGEHNFIHQYGCKPSRYDQYPGEGVFKSTDGGNTWTQAGEKFSDSIVKIVVNPIDTKVIYAASFDGIFRSEDSGGTWKNILSGIATDLIIDENSPSVLFGAIGKPGGNSDNGIYKSTDNGASWVKLTNGLPESEKLSRISMAICLSDPSVLYAAITYQNSDNVDTGDVFKTSDGGISWALTSHGPNPDCYKSVIAVDPDDPDTVYAGDLLIRKTTDGGESWVNIDPEIKTYVDYHAIAISRTSPQTVYTGNDRGVYKSDDGGVTWINLNNNLAITQFYDIALDPGNSNVIYGGSQDNGVLKYLGTLEWIDVDYFNDGGYCAVDYVNTDTVYFENQYGVIKKSLDGGMTSAVIDEGIDTSRTGFVTPFVMDPNDHDKLYIGTYMMHRTANGGDDWEIISPDLTKNLGTYKSFISAIGVSKSAPDVIYAGTSDGNLQVTTDGGETWNLRTDGLPNRFVTDISVDEETHQVAYVAFSGYGTGHIYSTDDAGQSWKSIDSNLMDIPVNTILIGHDDPGTVYIGTDIGIFKSLNRGRNWFPFNDELPVVVVSDLEKNNDTALIRAATMGRSVFEIDETGDVNGDGQYNGLDLLRVIKIILRLPPSSSAGELIRADVNADGTVNFEDIEEIIDLILGK